MTRTKTKTSKSKTPPLKQMLTRLYADLGTARDTLDRIWATTAIQQLDNDEANKLDAVGQRIDEMGDKVLTVLGALLMSERLGKQRKDGGQ